MDALSDTPLDPVVETRRLLEDALHRVAPLGALYTGCITIHVAGGLPQAVSPDHPRDHRYAGSPPTDQPATARETQVLDEIEYHLHQMQADSALGALVVPLVAGLPMLPLRARVRRPIADRIPLEEATQYVRAQLVRFSRDLVIAGGQGSLTLYAKDGRPTEVMLERPLTRTLGWHIPPALRNGAPDLTVTQQAGFTALAQTLETIISCHETGSVCLDFADGQPLLPLAWHGQQRITVGKGPKPPQPLRRPLPPADSRSIARSA